MDLSISRNRRTHVQKPESGRFLRDERPLISSSRRLSAVEHLRRKTTSRIMANGRLNRPNDRVIFLFLTAEKTIETSNYADREKNVKYKCGLLGCCCSSSSRSSSLSFPLSLPLFLSVQSARLSRRDSIIAALSRLYSAFDH